jgi:pilus assembly protein Flp/PilA
MTMGHDGRRLVCAVRRFARDRRGVTAMEYGLLTGLIALAIVSALSMFSTDVNQLFSYLSGTI